MEDTPETPIQLDQTIRWLEADMETPISLYLKLVGNQNGILLESAEVDGRWGRHSVLACDYCFIASCADGKLKLNILDERFQGLRRHSGKPWLEGMRGLLADIEIRPAAPDLPPITRALYGFLGFGMASIFNPWLQKIMPAKDAQSMLALPGTVLVFDHLYNRLCQISLGDPREIPLSGGSQAASAAVQIGEITAYPGESGYKDFVRDIRERLRKGEAIQVVPSTRFCAPIQGDPFLLYRRMRRVNASPYMFYMNFPKLVLFGSSPEVMVRCAAGRLELSPIAGTRKRGATPSEDAAMASELLRDEKERAEHVMLVDLGRNDLGRIAAPGSVKVENFMQVQKFSHVMHLTSDVSARLNQGQSGSNDALDVLAATFPAGTVSGAPKFRAMEIIRELEGTDRGPYAGCIGWIGLDRDSVNLDMGIAIRCMWVADGLLCWQAGGGIVHDSDPDLEWKEVCNKSAIMRLALGMEAEENVPSNR